MDSRELFDIISPWDRTATDGLAARILAWVGRAVPPEYVYSPQQMGEWAMRNGYRLHDDAELCALLKRAQEHVPAYTPLSVAINDAVAARKSLYG